MTHGISMGADFQDFKGAARMILGNAWHTRSSPIGCSFCSCEVSLIHPVGLNESQWPIGGDLIRSSSC